jgi:hypothetical protein
MGTVKTIIQSNGSKWMGETPDGVEKLLEVLSTETLDPEFEAYGNFIQAPEQIKFVKPYPDFEGLHNFFGNFITVSHVFNIWTNDPKIIKELSDAINKNKETLEYKFYRLPDDIEQLVAMEVNGSFETYEIKNCKTFQEFWEKIEILNAYEEEWKHWKARGIRSVYERVFNQLR